MSKAWFLRSSALGLAAAIIVNGQLIRGVQNSAGEVGHATVDRNGESCACGSRAAWKLISAGPGYHAATCACRIALDEVAVPPGYALTTPRRDVQVPRNNGALVLLDAAPVRAVTGHLLHHHAAGVSSPAGSHLWLTRDGERVAAPLGRQGRFYLEGLAPGRHMFEVDSPSGPLQCQIDVPGPRARAPGVVDLGEVSCGEASLDGSP